MTRWRAETIDGSSGVLLRWKRLLRVLVLVPVLVLVLVVEEWWRVSRSEEEEMEELRWREKKPPLERRWWVSEVYCWFWWFVVVTGSVLRPNRGMVWIAAGRGLRAEDLVVCLCCPDDFRFV